MEKVYERSENPTSDSFVRKYLGSDAKILKYEELDKFNSIKELLPKKRDFVVMLVETTENCGHWFAIVRINKTITYFDSYGLRPDKSLLWTDKYTRKSLNQDIPFVSLLLNKAIDEGFKVYFNEIKFQDITMPKYVTCGLWCISFILYYMKHNKPTLKGYYDMIRQIATENELTFDLTISLIFI
jgi:hypothetical protein